MRQQTFANDLKNCQTEPIQNYFPMVAQQIPDFHGGVEAMATAEQGKEPLDQKYFRTYVQRLEMFADLRLHIHEQTIKYPPTHPNEMFLKAEHLSDKFIT